MVIPLILLMLTAQEGRLSVDTDASLNTGRASCATAAAVYLCAPMAEFAASAGVKTGANAALLSWRYHHVGAFQQEHRSIPAGLGSAASTA